MNRKDFYQKLDNDVPLTKQIIDKYTLDITNVIDLIKAMDRLKHPDADITENVVDIEVIRVPLLAALIDAHYQGMFTQHKKSK